MPAAKLFTDLDKLEEGDLFIITILNRKFAYKVDQISVIEPEDVSALSIIPEKDYVTLLTCTPYGVNTHRLLVRGERTELPEEELSKTQTVVEKISPLIVLAVGFLVLILILALIRFRHRKKTTAEKEE